jgi:hypothetical protein
MWIVIASLHYASYATRYNEYSLIGHSCSQRLCAKFILPNKRWSRDRNDIYRTKLRLRIAVEDKWFVLVNSHRIRVSSLAYFLRAPKDITDVMNVVVAVDDNVNDKEFYRIAAILDQNGYCKISECYLISSR